MTYLYRCFLFLLSLTITGHIADAQRLKKADKAIINQLAGHQNYLSVKDTATGSKRLTEYICGEFRKSGIVPKGEAGTYYRSYTVPDGMEGASRSFLFINKNAIRYGDYSPLLMSPAIMLEAAPSLALLEAGQPWFLNLGEVREQARAAAKSGQNQPDTLQTVVSKAGDSQSVLGKETALAAYVLAKARNARQKGATALFIYNTNPDETAPAYDCYEGGDSLPLPIIYIRPAIARKYFMDETSMLAIKLKVEFTEKTRRKQYIAGLIDNKALSTVVIGAPGNSSDAGVLIELGKLLKKSRYKNNNYLLITISSEKESDAKEKTAAPVKPDYIIDTQGLNGADKLHYLYSLVEKIK